MVTIGNTYYTIPRTLLINGKEYTLISNFSDDDTIPHKNTFPYRRKIGQNLEIIVLVNFAEENEKIVSHYVKVNSGTIHVISPDTPEEKLQKISQFFEEWKPCILEFDDNYSTEHTQLLQQYSLTPLDAEPVLLSNYKGQRLLSLLTATGAIVFYPSRQAYFMTKIGYDEYELLDHPEKLLRLKETVIFHEFSAEFANQVVTIRPHITYKFTKPFYKYVFKNGTYVIVCPTKIVAFDDNEVTPEEAGKIAKVPFVILENIIETSMEPIRDIQTKKRIKDPIKTLQKLFERSTVNGPTVKRVKHTIITPRGAIVRKTSGSIVADEFILDAIRYVLGNTTNNKRINGRKLVIRLNSGYSQVKIVNSAELSWTGYVCKIGGKVFWNDSITRNVTNGKYTVLAHDSSKPIEKNTLFSRTPISKRALKKISLGKDVYVGDMFPGLNKCNHPTDHESPTRVIVHKMSSTEFRVEVEYSSGSKKTIDALDMKFEQDKVVYKKVPYINGVATLQLSWDHDGSEVVDMILPAARDNEVTIHYHKPLFINENEKVHVTTYTNGLLYDYSVRVIKDVGFTLVTFFIRSDQVLVKYLKTMQVFDEIIPILSLKDLKTLLVFA